MYEHVTPEDIQQQITDRADTTVMTREGSFFEMHTKPVAWVLSELYHTLDKTIPIAFVDETSGPYLERRAAEFGILRKPGQKATVTLVLTGQPGCTVPQGTRFHTADGLIFATVAPVRIETGTAQAVAAAQALGSLYNVPAGAITGPVQQISKLDAATNPAPAEGGVDTETDAALFRRLDAFRKTPATSGNRWHYEQWAMAVPGVGAARCIEIWDGPGTVKVLLADAALRPVSDAVRRAAADYIETQRPVCPEVTVESVVGVPVRVSADVVLDTDATAQQVQTDFTDALAQYIGQTVFDHPRLSYNRIAFLLMDVPGVLDYTALTVNGGTDGIDLPLGQVPLLEEVTVRAAEGAAARPPAGHP